MNFLPQIELRPVSLPEGIGLSPLGLALGQGSSSLEIAIASAPGKPTVAALRRAWNARLGGRAVPLLLVVLYGDKAAICGPAGREPPAYTDLDANQVERLCLTALHEPDRHAALRFLQGMLPEVGSPLPGIRNEGLLATHELVNGVPRRPDWQQANVNAARVLDKRGQALLRALGFEIHPLDGPLSVLAARGTKVAVALLLERSEPIDMSSNRYSGLSPVAYALARADRERLPYVLLAADGQLRLYPVKTGVGTGQRGWTETFVQLHLDLLPSAQAGYLWLLLSADALIPGGSLETILEGSADYAADLSGRLRDRVYKDVVPQLTAAIAWARGPKDPSAEDLKTTYQAALTLLFRLLFVAYAEDKDLLPYRTNDLYRARSLKQKARELMGLIERSVPFGHDPSQWGELTRLFSAIDRGKPEWGVPAYNGGLFSADPGQSPAGALLEELALDDADFGPPLSALLLDDSPEGVGPVDFRSLGVREFGTIYEGLLESEASVATTDLGIDKDGLYVPVADVQNAVVRSGDVYLHTASGARKATGSYYTKSFAVDHLLDHALEPALSEHLKRLELLDERGAGESFFDFRVVDIAMGSGHFLVAAVDRIERALSGFLAERPLPAVREELSRLRARGSEAIQVLGGNLEIEDSQLLRRQVARRCIYGVDLNPIAVELARLSLWVHTFVPGLPLSLLDYNLVIGNSLVGIATMGEAAELLGTGVGTGDLFASRAKDLLRAAKGALERLGHLADADASEVARAREAYSEAQDSLRPAQALFDILAASRLDDGIRRQIASGAATHWANEPLALPGSDVHDRARRALEAIPPLHFPTAFPQVFLRERPGFDVILGNPPWEEATLEEDRFWARYFPGLQGLPQREQEALKAKLRRQHPDLMVTYQKELAEQDLLRRVLVTGPYPGMGTGDPDVYKAFVWRFWHLATRPTGRIGVVLPRSAWCAKGSAEFRRAVLETGIVTDLTMMLNNKRWVFEDVHPQYTIGLVALQTVSPSAETTVPFRGPYRNLERFKEGVRQEPARFAVHEVFEWTDTAALPLLPTDDSVEVFAQLRRSPRLDLEDERSWRARPFTELHATNDKKLKNGRKLMHFVKEAPEGYWPIYKGESFDIWEPDTGTYYAWADPDLVLRHLQAKRERASRNRNSPFSEFDEDWVNDPDTLPCLRARIAFRDVTRATDSRTVRAALIPPRVFITNKGPCLLWHRGDEKDQAFLLGVLCSIPLDWYARRFVETTLNFHIFNPFPVPRPRRSSPLWKHTIQLAGRLACPDERFREWAQAVGVDVGSTDTDLKDDTIAELDAVVAHLYGLGEGHLRHIFETFHEGWDYQTRLEATLAHYEAWQTRL